MPPLLRSGGRACHYCRRRSNKIHPTARQFRCQYCLADNFFDKNGEFTDVPYEQASAGTNITQPLAVARGESKNIADVSLFCSNCLKNQYFLIATLSEYLPDRNHTSYAQYEQSFSQYRAQLEERYPPVCSRCEPGAVDQIRSADYLAKTEYLHQMRHQSLGRGHSQWRGWRKVMVTGGKILAHGSIFGQLVWHVVSQLESPPPVDTFEERLLRPRPTMCLTEALTTGQASRGCSNSLAPAALLAIICGLISAWWNPRWEKRLRNRHIRLVGLREYYHVNTALLLMRLGFWAWAHDGSSLHLSEVGFKLAHGLAMAFLLILTIYVHGRVRVDATPLVDWSRVQGPLLPAKIDHDAPQEATSFTPNQWNNTFKGSTSLDINSLGPRKPQESWKPPPVRGIEDSDSMEWEPVHRFQPRTQAPKPPSGPSPFYGVLPPAPSNRYLHPQAEYQAPPREAIGLPAGMFDQQHSNLPARTGFERKPIAPPSFFSQQDRAADTGLEALFDNVFSIREMPAAPQSNESSQDIGGANRDSPSIKLPWYSAFKLDAIRALKLVIFAGCLGFWYTGQSVQYDMQGMQSTMLCVAGLVFIAGATAQGVMLRLGLDLSDLIFSMVMTLMSVFLFFDKNISDNPGRRSPSRYSQGIVYFLLACFWELPRIVSVSSQRPSPPFIPSLEGSQATLQASQLTAIGETPSPADMAPPNYSAPPQPSFGSLTNRHPHTPPTMFTMPTDNWTPMEAGVGRESSESASSTGSDWVFKKETKRGNKKENKNPTTSTAPSKWKVRESPGLGLGGLALSDSPVAMRQFGRRRN